jgi:hypothetical protein
MASPCIPNYVYSVNVIVKAISSALGKQDPGAGVAAKTAANS